MTIVVQVTQAELRGMPFSHYASILHQQINECYGYKAESIAIFQADRAAVILDDRSDSFEALDILEMTREITDPHFINNYFGKAA
jgi:hypothetical protein